MKLSRRQFLGTTAAPLLLPILPIIGCKPSEGHADSRAAKDDPDSPAPDTSTGPRVALAADPDVVESRNRADGVKELMTKALGGAGGGEPGDFLQRLFHEDERIGIKVNMLAGRGMSTSVDVVEALVAELRAAGRGGRGIVVFDRLKQELVDVGYPTGQDARDRGYRLQGTDEAGYSRELYVAGRVGSLLSEVFLGVDALISVGVVKDHDLAGVGGCTKNLFGLIHNPNRYHDHNCDPYLADVLGMEEVKKRLRLSVADGLTAEWHGGPAYVRANTWSLGTIFASPDPLALDAVLADIIDAKRKEKGLPTLAEANRPPRWLDTAVSRGLGVADLDAIQRIEK
ncbi:MAG: DUF362 domain-containing protein [Deltaproteobacteria bacterium]|nr:DUF362 domain-containing protein [Deltaproteobacteria bacterium]